MTAKLRCWCRPGPGRNGRSHRTVDFCDPSHGLDFGQQARRKVEMEYSPESRAKTLIGIYDDVYRPAVAI